MMIIGVPGCMGGAAANSNILMIVGGLMFFLGLAVFVVGRFDE